MAGFLLQSELRVKANGCSIYCTRPGSLVDSFTVPASWLHFSFLFSVRLLYRITVILVSLSLCLC